MSKNVQSVLLSSALAGLMAGAVACGKKAETEAPAPAASAASPAKEAPAAATATTGGVHATNPAAMPSHECKGMNDCAGKGGCKVEGQNECKGKNPCKGKGGCKM
jgi:hypothetical protein